MGTTTKYMCLHLPESEHQTVALLIESWFRRNGKNAKIVYRPLIEGHIENHREVRITSSVKSLHKFMEWFSMCPTVEDCFANRIVTNPHRLEKAEIHAYPEYDKKFLNDDGRATEQAKEKMAIANSTIGDAVSYGKTR